MAAQSRCRRSSCTPYACCCSAGEARDVRMWIGGRGALLALRRRALVEGEQRLLRSSLSCCGARGVVWMLRASDQTFAIPTRCRRGSASALWQWHWRGVRGGGRTAAVGEGEGCVYAAAAAGADADANTNKRRWGGWSGQVQCRADALNKASAAARRGGPDTRDCEPKKGLTKQTCAAVAAGKLR